MSVGPDGTYDILLQDTETNPQTQLGLVLDYGNSGLKEWREGRVPPIPSRQSEGPLSWTHKDPISDFVFAQTSWSGGAFLPYYDDEHTNRYAKSDGVDLRWDGVAALGPRRDYLGSGGTTKSRIQSNMFLRNGDWETGLVTGWTAGTGVTSTIDTTTVRTGNYAGKAVVASGTAAGAVWTQTFARPTIYRSREITIGCYLRRDAGSDSGVFLRLTDSAGTPTDSAAVTTAAWTYKTVTRTIDSGATSVTVTIEHNTLTAASHTFYMDDLFVFPTGGVECVGSALLGTSTHQIYLAVGRCILLWTESSLTWEAVFINTWAATDIIEYNNKIYVAFGAPDGATGHEYVFGEDVSWTESAINASDSHHDNHAKYWAKARNGFGTWSLWKAGPSSDQGAEVNRVAWADNPTNTSGAWNPISATQSVDYYVVGSSGRAITGLHRFRDTFVVAKVDGIWAWSAEFNDFEPLTSEWETSMSNDNGAVGTMWQNDLYLTSVRQGFWRLDGNQFQDLTSLLLAPRLTDFGGKITAMGASARELILAVDPPVADTTTDKTSRLVRMRVGDQSGVWELHTTAEPEIGLIDCITFHLDTRLWVIGRTYNSDLSDYIIQANVFTEPDKIAAPYADVTPAIEQSGYFDTVIWHGNAPETDKALIALTIWCKNLDTEHPITVTFGTDGDAASTTILGLFNSTKHVQTLLFKNIVNPKDNAICRFVQLRFTFATDDTVSPQMFAFALHTQLVPEPIRIFHMTAQVGGGTRLRSGVFHELTKAEFMGVFRELEAQVFPITMVEDLGQGHSGAGQNGTNVRQVRLVDYVRLPADDLEQGQERWELVLQEVSIQVT